MVMLRRCRTLTPAPASSGSRSLRHVLPCIRSVSASHQRLGTTTLQDSLCPCVLSSLQTRCPPSLLPRQWSAQAQSSGLPSPHRTLQRFLWPWELIHCHPRLPRSCAYPLLLILLWHVHSDSGSCPRAADPAPPAGSPLPRWPSTPPPRETHSPGSHSPSLPEPQATSVYFLSLWVCLF